MTGTIAAEAARGCIPPTRRGIRRFRGEFACVLRPSVPRAKRSRCRAPWRRARRRPATPEPLRGTPRFHPLPTHGRPWVPSATLLPATPSRHRGRPSVASRQRDQPAAFEGGNGWGPTPSKGAVGPSRGAVALAAATPYRDGTGGLRGTPEHRPTPALQLSAASSPCLARPALSHRGSARRRCPPPLRGAGCRGTAGGQTGSGGRHVVGIAVGAGRPAAVNWKRTRPHQGGNKLAGQAHTTGEVTFSVTQIGVSRCDQAVRKFHVEFSGEGRRVRE